MRLSVVFLAWVFTHFGNLLQADAAKVKGVMKKPSAAAAKTKPKAKAKAKAKAKLVRAHGPAPRARGGTDAIDLISSEQAGIEQGQGEEPQQQAPGRGGRRGCRLGEALREAADAGAEKLVDVGKGAVKEITKQVQPLAKGAEKFAKDAEEFFAEGLQECPERAREFLDDTEECVGEACKKVEKFFKGVGDLF